MSTFTILNMSVPFGAVNTFGTPLCQAYDKHQREAEVNAHEHAQRLRCSASRRLTDFEQRKLQGRAGENPYLAGQEKWDVVYKGINLMTGNYSTSATDLSFDGGYGVPVNVTRSYSANNMDEGPFGKGWTLSADTRSVAGSLVKAPSMPIKVVPVSFKERPTTETDPNVEMANGAIAQPPVGVIATDAGGNQETIQRDIDGVLTTPPWDANTNQNTQYEIVTGNDGMSYQIMTHNETVTPEGTRYTYDKKGYYLNGGTKPWNDATATAQPSNVLKVTSVTDRQGNVTTYSYASIYYDYSKSNGTTHENPLGKVTMPGGHELDFTWGTSGSAQSRIINITDATGGRKVVYTYSGAAGHGLLTSVTTPGLKKTTFGYSDINRNFGGTSTSQFGIAAGILTQITDPRGLTTSLTMAVDYSSILSRYLRLPAVITVREDEANGVFTLIENPWVFNEHLYGPDDGWGAGDYDLGARGARSYGPDGYEVGAVGILFARNPSSNTFCVEALSGYREDTHAPRNYRGPTEPLNYNANNSASPSTTQFSETKQTYTLSDENLIRQDSGSVGPSNHYDVPSKLYGYPGSGAGAVTLFAGRFYGSTYVGNLTGWMETWPVVITSTSYNFRGDPLSRTIQEGNQANRWLRSATTSYAYWGADKYYQQKATRDQGGRYSYTDYYPKSAAAGKRGQVYRIYDAKNAGFSINASSIVPAQTNPSNAWKYQLEPSNVDAYTMQFDYDPQGRAVDVWKLRTTSPAWSYTQTHTTFGGDGAPEWGQANQVVEDYGIGKANRTTQTVAYTSWGRPSDIRDAAGHEFVTSFDADGLVKDVQRVDIATPQNIVSYVYGTVPGTLTCGQITSVTDGLSGVTQTIEYASSGGGKGRISSVSEEGGGNPSYSVSYTYNSGGDRETAVYTTPNGTRRWGYYDYVEVGTPGRSARVFQTMALLDDAGLKTAEEIHYTYDSVGRIIDSAFAQTPSSSARQSNGSFYSQTVPAAQRARAHYDYDPAGRLQRVSHYWETWTGQFEYSTPIYTKEAIVANECEYELTGLSRGLKTASRFYVKNPSSPANFSLDHTESFGYDAQTDALTSVNYGDGLPNAVQSWSYDASGNRNDAICDNLNRATTLGVSSVTNDTLGNRTSKGGVTYGWDATNRLVSLSGATTAAYTYRTDGMRVGKSTAGVSSVYRYDGQMGIEDVETPLTGTPTITRYGLGARGIDYIEKTQGSAVAIGFPLYDTHGNNVGTLSRNGSGYALNDRRSYDAWGVVRSQQSAGDPKLRYCAVLGHRHDDESGLVYMRARYYDPSAGRFISEDPARHKGNWYIYASNDPVGRFDATGKEELGSFLAANGMAGTLSGLGVQTLTGSIEIVESVATVEVTMFEGSAAANSGALSTQVINVVRQWAMGNGINQIWVQSIAASREGAMAAALAVRAIQDAGDSGQLIKSDTFTYIYWLISE